VEDKVEDKVWNTEVGISAADSGVVAGSSNTVMGT